MSEHQRRPGVSLNNLLLDTPLADCKLSSRLPQIYDEFYHTVNNADHEKDLRWWSNTHGVNMPMAWPQFEVGDLINLPEEEIDTILFIDNYYSMIQLFVKH